MHNEIWPGGHRAALSLVIHVPAVADASATNAATTLVGIDYAATGLQRLLDAVSDFDVSATTAWTAAAIATSPQLVRAAADQGHDVAISITHESAGDLVDVRATAQRLAGVDVTGVAELYATSSIVNDLPADLITWTISRQSGDFPSLGVLTSDAPTTVSLPTSPYWIDAVWLNPAVPAPPSAFLETLSTALQSMRTVEGLMTVVIHPHISGRPGFVETITRFLDEAIASGDVWIAKASDIAAWWRTQHGAPGKAE